MCIRDRNKGSNITLTSIHSAKGLEYDRVYIIDNLREMNFDKKNLDEDEYEKKLEEERRIFYVGMTRAKDELNICLLYTSFTTLRMTKH